MARVFERPRYINQTKNKVVSLAVASQDIVLQRRTGTAIGLTLRERYSMRADYDLLADMALDGYDVDPDLPHLSQQMEEYLLDSEIGRMSAQARLTAPPSAKLIVRDMVDTFDHYKPDRVLCDEDAVYWLISRAIQDTKYYEEPRVAKRARRAAHDLIFHQLASQKVAPGLFQDVFKGTSMVGAPPRTSECAAEWAHAAEGLLTRSHPMWVKYCRLWACPPRRIGQHLSRMIDRVRLSAPHERHATRLMRRVLPDAASYNYAGVTIIHTEKVALIIDSSAAAYFRTCMGSWHNATWGFSLYRPSGDTCVVNLINEFIRCIAWIARAVSVPGKARYVARHMHLAYTKWQNAVGERDAPIDCGWEARDKSLHADMVTYYPHNDSWYKLVDGLRVPERTKAEFYKLYHLLPPPDIDPLLLHETLIERTSSENSHKPSALSDFIKFCKSYDLSRFLAKRKRVPKMGQVEGYIAEEQGWFKRSRAGKLTMPPQADIGKAWLMKEFSYDPTGDFHVFDAKDSTRVVADLGAYMDRQRSRTLSKVDQNELLSAIFNGAQLSNGESMSDWRRRVMENGVTEFDYIIAAEAGKAENTKVGSKVRETLSAADTVREFLTEVDHSMRPLAALTPGVSLRVDLVKHKKRFQAMAHSVSAASSQHAFATSTDISGWSPKMPRKVFHAWQTYALGTTECPNPAAPIALWDRLVLFCDRRGVKRSAPCRGGNIQGWPATSDTTMHAHILIMWAYELRRLGILSKKEAAYVLCYIDDGATVVALEGTVDECVKKAARARQLLADMYYDLGFIMDEVKSFFSSIKFIYLNELYVDGAQIAHGTKTIMRIDKDYTRRFASLSDNIATAFGTAGSAASQGADPFVCYFMAAARSYEWAMRARPELEDVATHLLTVLALAPRHLNGLGIKSITSAMSTGENDHLTWFIEIVGNLAAATGSADLSRAMSAFLTQELAVRSPLAVFSNPMAVVSAGHLDSSGAIRGAFRDAARAHRLAEPFSTLDEIERDPEYEEVVKEVLMSGVFEASLLEEVAASMPTAFVDETMARVDKTELVAYLLGPAGIANLRRRVRASDLSNLLVGHELLVAPSLSHRDLVAEYESVGSFTIAKRIRESAFEKLGVQIINHTYPCPFALWAFRGPMDPNGPEVTTRTAVTFHATQLRRTAASATANLYDSALAHPGYKGYKSMKANVANEARVLLFNPVRKKLARGFAALRWAVANGAHYRPLADLFMIAWSGKTDDRLLSLPGREAQGSAKRLSLRHSKANHLILPFPNTQASVSVNAHAVTRKHGDLSRAGSSMYDMMAAITALRCASLLEAALCVRAGLGGFCYGFAYKPASAAILDVADGDSVDVAPSRMEKIRPFSSITGPLGAAARVVCSPASMARIITEQEAAGSDAATKMFEALVEDADIAEDAFDDMPEAGVKVRLMTIADKYATIAKAWEAPVTTRKVGFPGVVAPFEGRMRAAARVAVEAPTLSPDDHVKLMASKWKDTLSLTLVEADSRLAMELARSAASASLVWHDQIEEWASRREKVRFKRKEMSDIVAEVSTLAPESEHKRLMSLFLRSLGVYGFHHAKVEGDLLHQVESFLGTTVALDGLGRAIGTRLRMLKSPTSEGYSSVSVAASSSSMNTVVRVIRAQWRLAAERKLFRVEESVKRLGHGGVSASGNYVAVYLKCAARTISVLGKFDKRKWHAALITQTIESLANHMETPEQADAFTSSVAEAGLDDADDLLEFEEAAERVAQIARVGQACDDSTSPSDISEALATTNAWVMADTAGAHVAIVRPRRMLSYSVSADRPEGIHSPSELGLPRADVRGPSIQEIAASAMEAPGIGGDEEEEEVVFDNAEAPDAFQWAVDEHGYDVIPGYADIHSAYAAHTLSEETFESWRKWVSESFDMSAYTTPNVVVHGWPKWVRGGDLADDSGDEEVVHG